MMLHSMKPSDFCAQALLSNEWTCFECQQNFVFGSGVISLSHYRVKATGEIKQGLMCFCSTLCLLAWEPTSAMGARQ